RRSHKNTRGAPPWRRRFNSDASVTHLCDGRQCSQMTSCDDATFFIKNCPDTKMDGDHDGVPCEEQWCSF
ncbi:excalibur calcium-binding domain-containing protein, partial [Methyloversatilis sp. XJ19-49]|uniref:excalibur calcium-binding domain-containing protein n=1 Tax=Methyloversatilis sp. XJ19-49 TaxID=2963429 RepID=UPI00211B8E30